MKITMKLAGVVRGHVSDDQPRFDAFYVSPSFTGKHHLGPKTYSQTGLGVS